MKVLGAPGVSMAPVTLSGATVRRVRREKLPGLGMARFSIGTKNAAARLLDRDLLLERSIQVWRDDRCVFWGQPLQPDGDTTSMDFTAVGLPWWIGRRYLGPILTNLLDPNSDFEDGLTGWTPVNCVATPSTAWRARGTQSAKLVQTTPGADAYLRRRVTVSTTTVPVFHAAKAALHVPSAGWIGPALDERGLYVSLHTSAGGPLVAGVEPQWEPITNHAEMRNQVVPIPMESGITVPAGLTNAVIEKRLMCPASTEGVYWDAAVLAVEQSVGSLLVGTTLTPEPAWMNVQRILDYVQGPEKDDLGFGFAFEAGTYPNVVRVHQFYDNMNALDAMLTYAKEGLIDLDVTWSPDGSTPVLRVWPKPPGRGTLKAGAAMEVGVNVGERSIKWGADASGVVTAARWLGQGSGATQDFGRAVDLSRVSRILESVDSAPLESPIDALIARAAQTVADDGAPRTEPSFPVRASVIFDNDVNVGDLIPVTADYGYIQEAGNRRVSAIDVDAEQDTALVSWEA